ncbi:Fanconi anemia-associated protein of 20 kDa, partial [Corchorus capsularis]
ISCSASPVSSLHCKRRQLVPSSTTLPRLDPDRSKQPPFDQKPKKETLIHPKTILKQQLYTVSPKSFSLSTILTQSLTNEGSKQRLSNESNPKKHETQLESGIGRDKRRPRRR